MVSVITATKRDGWQDVAKKSLDAQTYRDFEYIVVYEPNVKVVDGLDAKWVKAPPKTKHSNLNASNNEGLRNAKGDYILFYQDFIELEPDTLEKLAKTMDDNTLITTATINPDGNKDQRYTGMDGIREIPPAEWEENVGLVPMKVVKALGGYDEDYDDGWAWNNVGLAERAEMLGCRFLIDESINPQLLFHVKEPDADPSLILNYTLHEMKMRLIRTGREPLKLPYL